VTDFGDNQKSVYATSY